MKEFPDLGFKVGDVVEDYALQKKGMVITISASGDHQIGVEFDDGIQYCYRKDGSSLDTLPILGYPGTIAKFNKAFPDGLAIVTERPKPKIEVKPGQVWAIRDGVYVVSKIEDNKARFRGTDDKDYCNINIMEKQILDVQFIANSLKELISMCTKHPHLTKNELKEANDEALNVNERLKARSKDVDKQLKSN